MAVRAFEAAARRGSFTHGAAEIGLTQSAVSRHVRLLEDMFGVRLFERHGRRVRLTASGEAYYGEIAGAFSAIQAANHAMAGRRRNENSVVVAALPSVATLWLAPRLGGFVSEHPLTELTVRAGRSVIDPGAEGVDVCLRYGTGPWENVDARLFAREVLTPVCSPHFAEHHGLDGSDPRRLLQCPLLEDDLVDGWDRWFSAAGLGDDGAPGRTRVDDSASLYRLASEGGGVALGRSLLVEGLLGEGRLIAPFAITVPATYSYWIVTPSGFQPRLGARQFLRWLDQCRAQEERT